MAQHNKVCKICGKLGHSQFYCKEKPYKQIAKVSRKRLASPEKPKINKPIRKVGKYGKMWEDTKKKWKEENPPDDSGFWYCKVGGAPLSDNKRITYGYYYNLNICHDKSRAHHKSLAYELSNLFPGCQRHNKDQGSKTLAEYLSKDHTIECGDY